MGEGEARKGRGGEWREGRECVRGGEWGEGRECVRGSGGRRESVR